ALLDMGDELGVFFGSSFSKVPWEILYQCREKDRTVRGLQTYASFTSNGATWSAPQPVYEPKMWLWQVEGFKGVYYGTVQNAERRFRLVRSTDGGNWETVSEIPSNRFKSTEAGVSVTEHGMMHVVIRVEGNTDMALLARSKPPYKSWDLRGLNYTVHSPVIRPVGDELWVAGRAYGKRLPCYFISPEALKEKVEALARLDERLAKPQEWHVALWRLVANRLGPIVLLPSRGDNAYPGMVVETGRVLVSYYSQHDVDDGPKSKPGEHASEIYLAEIGLRNL
ncbi:MAG: exo-alpha-sialidase, partial [Candidatus Latescibacteria bacterium]|nr:exo-alpha-sialidase [Candidatus Latescibacterota bacterium]